jgi:hypothetical protein
MRRVLLLVGLALTSVAGATPVASATTEPPATEPATTEASPETPTTAPTIQTLPTTEPTVAPDATEAPTTEPPSASSAPVVTSDVQTTTVRATASDSESVADVVTTDGTQAPTITVQPISTPSSTTTTAAPPSLDATAAPVVALAVAPQVSGVRATIGVAEAGSFRTRVVTISWLGSGADYYDLERRHSTTNVWKFLARRVIDGEASIEDFFYDFDDDVIWGTYQYRVTPSGGAPGYVSVNVTRPSYPPSMPGSVRAAAGFGAVTVTWAAPTTTPGTCFTGYHYCDPATSYTVAWAPSGGTWQRVTTTGTNRTISGLRVGVTYFFTVRANNSSGSSASTDSVTSKPMAPTPTAPRQPAATPGVGRVTLTWVSPASQGASAVTRQVIQRSQNQINWVNVTTTLAPAARSYTVTGLANWVRYYFRIASVNGHGQGPWSTIVTAATGVPPSVPRSLTATARYNQVTLRWAAPASTGGSPIIGYRISYAPSGGTWKSVNVSVSTRILVFTSLRGGTTYYFSVAAYNAIGRSPSTTSIKAVPKANTVPGAPSFNTVLAGNHSVGLYWSQPANTGGLPITYYQVQIGYAGVWRNLASLSGGTRAYTATGLVNGRTYYFRVRAANSLGWSPSWSTTVRVVPNI